MTVGSIPGDDLRIRNRLQTLGNHSLSNRFSSFGGTPKVAGSMNAFCDS
jgi:hypothetical protein